MTYFFAKISYLEDEDVDIEVFISVLQKENIFKNVCPAFRLIFIKRLYSCTTKH
jgi:hypothetical protein